LIRDFRRNRANKIGCGIVSLGGATHEHFNVNIPVPPEPPSDDIGHVLDDAVEVAMRDKNARKLGTCRRVQPIGLAMRAENNHFTASVHFEEPLQFVKFVDKHIP
jgi:hypothetical protein